MSGKYKANSFRLFIYYYYYYYSYVNIIVNVLLSLAFYSEGYNKICMGFVKRNITRKNFNEYIFLLIKAFENQQSLIYNT